MNKKHPYYLRLMLRERLPWLLIDLGIAKKGKDCKSVGAEHKWYNIDGNESGCYFCQKITNKVDWKNKKY